MATKKSGPSAGARGGAANERGSVHRASVAASIVTTGLSGRPVLPLRMTATPTLVAVETDSAVDDLVVQGADGQHVFVQAKASLDMGKVMRDVAAQWAKAVENGEVGPGDVLAVVASELSGTVETLQAALDARRQGTSPWGKHKTEIDKLRSMLVVHLTDPAHIDLVLDVATVAKFETDRHGSVEREAVAALDDSIVAAGSGTAAFEALRAQFAPLAARRGRADFEDWLTWLELAGVPARNDPDGPRATRAAASRAALRRWRAGHAARLDVLRSDWPGVDAEDLHVPGLASEMMASVGRPDRSGVGTDHPLLAVVRRYPRMLLGGQGGTGKSFALSQVAAFCCSRDDGPTPLVVSFKDLATRMPLSRPTGLTIEEVIETATRGESPELRDALAGEARGGNLILLFDALDEVASDRTPLVLAVRDLVDALPETTDVIMTSRYPAMDTLEMSGFPPVDLRRPARHDDTLDVLLEHLVDSVVPAGEAASRRVSARQALANLRQQTPSFGDNPLLSTLAVVLISQGAVEALPTSRARVLLAILEAAVRRWNARRQDSDLPGLGQFAVDALLDVYCDIAAVVAADGDWHTARAVVAARLAQHWGLQPGPAHVTALAALTYWDHSAGVFSTSNPQGTLTAPIAVFTELGEAASLQRDPGTAVTWLASAVRDRDKWETVRLAAGMYPTVATELVTLALADGGELLDLALDAHRDGVPHPDEQYSAIVDAQLLRIPELVNAPDPAPAETTAGRVRQFATYTPPAARLAETLCRLRLTGQQRDALVRAVEPLGAEQQHILTAIAARAAADRPDDPEVLDAVEQALTTIVEAPDADASRVRAGRLAGRDELFDLATQTLYLRRSGTRPLVEAAVRRRGTLRTQRKLNEAMRLVAAPAPAPPLEIHIGDPTVTPSDPVGAILADNPLGAVVVLLIDAPSVGLTRHQRWHRQQLGELLDLLDLGAWDLGAVNAALAAPDELRQALVGVMQAAGLDEAVVRAQAAAYADDPDARTPVDSLWVPSVGMPALNPTPEHLVLAVALLAHGGPVLAQIANELLTAADQLPPAVIEALEQTVDAMTAPGRLVSGYIMARHEPARPLATDSLVRAGQGMSVAEAVAGAARADNADLERLVRLYGDLDLLVRHRSQVPFSVVPAEHAPALLAAAGTSAGAWTCENCATVQAVGVPSCKGCSYGRQPVLVPIRRTE